MREKERERGTERERGREREKERERGLVRFFHIIYQNPNIIFLK